MKQYKYILFDLDGTLTESAEGITNALQYALEKYHILVKDKSELLKFVGPPLKEAFMESYNWSEEEAVRAITYFREYYTVRGIFENRVYAGISVMLEQLKARGKCLIVATSKPEEHTVRILEHFELTKYFDFVAGATLDDGRVKKSDVIAYAMAKNNISEVSKLIMVGDRRQDIEGARANQIDSVGVLYGYGSRAELEKAGATYIAETVEELGELLAG